MKIIKNLRIHNKKTALINNLNKGCFFLKFIY